MIRLTRLNVPKRLVIFPCQPHILQSLLFFDDQLALVNQVGQGEIWLLKFRRFFGVHHARTDLFDTGLSLPLATLDA